MIFNKNTRLIAAVFALLSAAFPACDKIDDPFKGTGNVTEGEQNVMIEEFTGHRCPNCPQATTTIKQLMDLYGDRIVPVAIHSGHFADTNSSYPPNYKTTTGDELDDFFNVNFYPQGLLNRTGYPESDHLSGHTSWPSKVDQLLQKDPICEIDLTHNYSAGSRKLTAEVTVTALEDFEARLMVSAYITEDSIVSPQTLPDDSRDPDYLHMFTFRGSMNGTWGDEIHDGIITQDLEMTTGELQINFKSGWVAENCHMVVFVYRDDTKEVLQATRKLVVE